MDLSSRPPDRNSGLAVLRSAGGAWYPDWLRGPTLLGLVQGFDEGGEGAPGCDYLRALGVVEVTVVREFVEDRLGAGLEERGGVAEDVVVEEEVDVERGADGDFGRG